MERRLEKFIKDQLSVWPLAAQNFRDLKNTSTRLLEHRGLEAVVQFNPCRISSTKCGTAGAALERQTCFLCPETRPVEQFHLEFEGRKGRKYRITVNPYPIFPSHLVVSSFEHTPQSIWHRYQDMLDFVKEYPDLACFYNGPECGASAPFHMHFQACPAGLMPLENKVDELLDSSGKAPLEYVACIKETSLYHLDLFVSGLFVLVGKTAKSVTKLFYRLLDCAPVPAGDSEPRANIISWYKGGKYRTAVIFRDKHRSGNYFSDGPDHLTMSPGAADLGGVLVTPEKEDYDKLDGKLLDQMFGEVCVSKDVQDGIIWRLTRRQPKLHVGIMSSDAIDFEIVSDGAGPQRVEYKGGKVSYNGALYDELTFEARTPSTMFSEPTFILRDVTIGAGFHWERKVTQQFAGTLKFIVDAGQITAVNIIGVEDYLLSVISSEMKSTADLEFLKAHAVISRSWVMARIEGRRMRGRRSSMDLGTEVGGVSSLVTRLDAELMREELPGTADEYVKWFDHEDHTRFDVCADDHCQRYQGLTMAVGENVRKAIDSTWGLVLTSGGEICDARFSKCCGGRTETFGTCWEDTGYPYLPSLPDTPGHDPDARVFCDTEDEGVLSKVLNDYDLETKDFYRWKVEYSRAEVSALLKRRSGIDFGTVRELVPLKRGDSGRIFLLKIAGDRRTMTVGKELIIRKWLSESHLKSSAFDVSWKGDTLTLTGSGWGHGVGLCQIGAAVMASEGYAFSEILEHYYPGSALERKPFEDED